ncbi:hypothetical protein WMF18_15835 [Sorangium sp. So ce315]|uniref:hypothetical protein n=1 Tax=Sorangium sp. So ce315 TaxID=3133299 RepID=UPI003F6307A1
MSRRLSFFRSLAAAGLVALASCGGTTAATPPSQSATTPAPAATAPPDAPATPRSIASLVDVVPSDATLVASLPQLGELLAGGASGLREVLLAKVAESLASQPGVDRDLAHDVTASLDDVLVFVGPEAAQGGAVWALLGHGCAAARFSDGAPVEQLLKALPRETGEDDTFALRDAEDGVIAHGAWLAEARVALLCARPAPLAKALRVAGQRAPSFRTSALFQAERAAEPWLALDLHRLSSGADAPEPGSRLFVALPMNQDASGLHVELAAHGPEYPRLGTVLAATDHGAMAKLPSGAVVTLGLSLQRSPGKTVSDVLGAFDGLVGEPVAAAAARALAEIRLELGDVDRALGGEAAIGIYRDPRHKLGLAGRGRDEARRHNAVLIAIATADAAAQKKVFDAVAADMKRTSKKVKTRPGWVAGDLDAHNEVRAESRQGFVLIGVGDRGFLAQVAARFGKEKESLAASPTFAAARARAKAPSHLEVYIDRQAVAGAFDGAAAASFAALGASPTLLSLTLAPSDRGLELTLGGQGGVELLGAGAALAVYGVRRYIDSAKAAEAKTP